jgi:dienelactone hydrolase
MLMPLIRCSIAALISIAFVHSAAYALDNTETAAQSSWAAFVEQAESEHGNIGRLAAEFLHKHRPARDQDLSSDFLSENLEYALRARREFPWAGKLDQERFFNDVLPYAIVDEPRDRWRAKLYAICAPLVSECQTAGDAAQKLNQNLFNAVNVHYNTTRKRTNQSPLEAIAEGKATCTGLSILLVAGCRSVGVPARIAGVAEWSDKRGNHTWVEIWDGDWHFLGADEYDPKGLDRAWFIKDAARAKINDRLQAVWATSWRKTGQTFPLAWNPNDTSVNAVNVTDRYTQPNSDRADSPTVFIRLWDQAGGKRLVAEAHLAGTGDTITTRAGQADLNDMPALPLPGSGPWRLIIKHAGREYVCIIPASTPDRATLDLQLDQLGLTKTSATQLVNELWNAHADILRDALRKALNAGVIEHDQYKLRLLEKTCGEAPPGGHSLWIALHGGGQTTAEVNDAAWQRHLNLYEPKEGIYIAPRAPTNTWNMWHQQHVDPLLDRLIAAYVIARGVNPDRVYLTGYSAGGDGVYQLAPRMADRFAAAAMMAGHPNEARPEGLRNLPFMIFMGGDDSAYNRNAVAKAWGERLDNLQQADPAGYEHQVTIYPGLGHWMEGRDASALPWMARHTRQPWPKRVVWLQDDVTANRFYWLQVDQSAAAKGVRIDAEIKDQAITLKSEQLCTVTLRLSDALLDLDQPITVSANGRQVFSGRVQRTRSAIEQSLRERSDPSTVATALLTVRW